MALTNKTVAGSYKDLLQVDNSNSGLTSSGKTIKDGDGNSSCLSLGVDKISVTPSASSTANVVMSNGSGDVLLKVDGTNKLVKVNETQIPANTQYLKFFNHDRSLSTGYHSLVTLFNGNGASIPNTVKSLGNGANPAVPTFSNDADDYIHYLHYVDTNITVDAVNVLVGAASASGDSLNFHLVALATGDTTTVDEFSSCTVVADDSGTSNSGYEQFYRVALDIQSANVDAGDYLALTVEADGTNSDYTINALVRYHLR